MISSRQGVPTVCLSSDFIKSIEVQSPESWLANEVAFSGRTASLGLILNLRLGRFALVHEGREQIDRDWKKRRRVVLAGDLTHGLQEAQL